LTMAVVYMIGVEQGVNSQQSEIAELYGKLNHDVLINPIPYVHPFRNVILGFAIFIGICWTVFITVSLPAKKARSCSYKLKRKTLTLMALIFMILASAASPVYADMPPPPKPRPDWLVYAIGVLLAETTAWLIGAESLWRLTRKTSNNNNKETSRNVAYKTMLLAMIISFSVGLLFWKMLGWM